MKNNCIFLLASLLLPACGDGTGPVTETPNSTIDTLTRAQVVVLPKGIHAGLLTYDGSGAYLTSCERQRTAMLTDRAFDLLLNEITVVKHDTTQRIWIEIDVISSNPPEGGQPPAITDGRVVSKGKAPPCKELDRPR